MSLLLITLLQLFSTLLHTSLLSHKIFIVLHTCIALQTSARLNTILDFGLSISMYAARLDLSSLI